MIRLIAMVSKNGILGESGHLCLNYKEDMRHFKKTTTGSTIIMGRKTFQEFNKPLPNRQNIVVSSSEDLNVPGIEIVSSIKQALALAAFDDVYFCGGASIYEEGMSFAKEIVLTIAPDVLRDKTKQYTHFPWINPAEFVLKSLTYLEDGSPLRLARYERLEA